LMMYMYLFLQLPVQSVPITTNVASSIQHYVIKFVSDFVIFFVLHPLKVKWSYPNLV
jgi:hypothetical protein